MSFPRVECIGIETVLAQTPGFMRWVWSCRAGTPIINLSTNVTWKYMRRVARVCEYSVDEDKKMSSHLQVTAERDSTVSCYLPPIVSLPVASGHICI